MNSDVPSLEASRRLAKAGLEAPDSPGEVWWWIVPAIDGPYLLLARRFSGSHRIYAPTLGEMLAEIRGRGAIFAMKVAVGFTKLSRHAYDKAPVNLVVAWGLLHMDAEALANATAEALEKEASDAGG